MTEALFHVFLWGHICAGAVGLVVFWVPIFTRKGGRDHVRGGRVFAYCMLITGAFAVGISSCTLLDPLGTHPHLDDAALVTGIFGWMMIYLAVLTVNLAWYGLLCIRNRRDHGSNAEWRNVALQYIVMALAVNTAVQGWLIDQILMMGISVVGIATGITNLRFIHRPASAVGWQLEHVKGLVGAGISVYTAFLAFGAVRLMPELALNPMLWAIPLVTGVAIILYQWRAILLRHRASRPRTSAAPA